MYFLSDTLKKIKLGVGVAGGAISIFGLIYGGITLNAGLAAISALFLLQSSFLLGDGVKIMGDAQKYVNNLRDNNEVLTESVESLERTSINYQSEVKQFSDALKEAEERLGMLAELEDKNGELMGELQQERKEFQNIISRSESKVQHLQALLDQYHNQLNSLSLENEELKTTREALKEQVYKLKELHENSKALIKNLVMAGDAFTQFQNEFGEASRHLKDTSTDLDETSSDLQETATLLKKIVDRLSNNPC